jgi:hypothetical protein
LARTPDGEARLQHALDSWLAYFTFGEATSDPARPVILWSVNNSVYSWFGHTYPGSGAAIDSPDNVYRGLAVDGSSRYEIHGQLRPMHPGQFSFQLVPQAGTVPTGTDLVTLGTLSDRDMDIGPDGAFTITIDSDPAGRRRNHIQSKPGPPLHLIIRDTLTNWRQNPNELRVNRISGPPASPPIEPSTLASNVADGFPGIVAGWLNFIGIYAGPPKENTITGPIGRTGGWGYMAPMRFTVADDEAVVITIDDGAAQYASIQLTDVWMLAPDPQLHLSNYTTAQSRPNADGTYTYVISKHDPGAANWVDAAGWNQGWIEFRWQGLPRTRKDATDLVRDVKFVKLNQLTSILAPNALGVTAEDRRQILQARGEEWRLRVATGRREIAKALASPPSIGGPAGR